jgi:uncharacterized protein YjbI with pentapeptide repeats
MDKNGNMRNENSSDPSPTRSAHHNELRPLSKKQLNQILDAHQNWIVSEGKKGMIADLNFTNLEGADLSNRNLNHIVLQGSNLKNANLSCSNFEEADLGGANLSHANLKEADLGSANLRQANLKEATLIGSILKDADIQDAEFLGTEFAGADMTGAKLSKDNLDFKPLESVEEISKNARTIFFVLLLACVYSWLTIATTLDVRLVTNSTSSRLPIIGTEIPIVPFYFAAPLVLMGVYVYFHFYLHYLWKALAMLPAKFPDGRTLNERAYPWLVNAIVRRHYKILKQDKSLIARLEVFGTILIAWWTVPATIIGFWARYLPRHEWVGTGFHLGFLTVSISLAILFYRSAANTLTHNKLRWFNWKNFKKSRNISCLIGVCLCMLFFLLLSHGAINGIRSKNLNPADIKVMVPHFFNRLGYDIFADLREIDVSSKPTDFWRIKNEEDRINSVKGAFLKKKNLRYADMFRAFLVKSILRNAKLEGARLRKANLQNSDIRGASLQRADLRGANLKGADLREARLMKADLTGAQLQNAKLGLALLQNADLNEVNLQNADLRCANLKGAKNLSVKTLAVVKTLYHAKLDAILLNQITKEFTHLLEEPEEQWVEPNLRKKCP